MHWGEDFLIQDSGNAGRSWYLAYFGRMDPDASGGVLECWSVGVLDPDASGGMLSLA
jgi:hypothetical protein